LALATSTHDHAGTFVQTFGRIAAGQPTLILTHNDADGLAAEAIFARGFARAGRDARVRILGRGENPWSQAMRGELAKETLARSAKRIDLVAFLAGKTPHGAGEAYGGGHRETTGGALEWAGWNEFVANLGFGPDMQVGA
jgi:hypothetical protein